MAHDCHHEVPERRLVEQHGPIVGTVGKQVLEPRLTRSVRDVHVAYGLVGLLLHDEATVRQLVVTYRVFGLEVEGMQIISASCRSSQSRIRIYKQ